MPRNRDKAPCDVAGCRNWAMRGHTRCRSHRDPELGPRGGGAPSHNLNALRTGEHAHPVSPADLHHLVTRIVRHPDRLPDHLALAIRSLHRRTADPYKALVALRALLSDLLPLVAAGLFEAGVEDRLRCLPPSQRRSFTQTIKEQIRTQSPEAVLLSLRTLIIESENPKKTSTGTGSLATSLLTYRSTNHGTRS
jgi:hypothetical protein